MTERWQHKIKRVKKSFEVEKTENKEKLVKMRVRISTGEERKNMLGMQTRGLGRDAEKRRTQEVNGVEEFSGHDKAIEHQGKYHLASS